MFPAGIPFSKRIFDLVITGFGVVLLSPFLLFLTFMVWTNVGPPLFFSQLRPGYRTKPFRMYKFRTMTNETDSHGNHLADEDRLTFFGRKLRSYSLDELPELVNILKGEMSLVGPRPLLMQYLELYSSEQARRHNVLPGITGWAQINGRNAISWEEKFKLDIWYVDHWSFWLDIKILFLTFWKVITREGINQPGFATAEVFMGNKPDKNSPTEGQEFH